MKRMKPELRVDPVLAFLDRVVADGAAGAPHLVELECLPEWWRDPDLRLTMAAAADAWDVGPWHEWASDVKERIKAVEGVR